MPDVRLARLTFGAVALFGVLSISCLAQTEDAAISGRITDQTGAVVAGVSVELTSAERGATQQTTTNSSGIYVFPAIHPGVYHITVRKEGFHQVDYVNLTANVQDHIEQNFKLQVGSVTESVTVTADTMAINTTDATVSTVIDQSYVKNMPLNGRSFQDLILLTPGVVTQTPQISFAGGLGQTGEFSVNGQRAESNYYSVDGVSANVGVAPGLANVNGAGASGSVAGATALGTTQALVSVDDLQEFRVNSSTYSAEYGRNPGGQFAFETKSGTNQWHGTGYDYLRNNYFDSNDWFDDRNKLPATALRQNDFGGALGGPVRIPGVYNGKDKTFFFFSYEGLRLLQPQPARSSIVPDLCLRGINSQCPSDGSVTPAPAAFQPVLNAFPMPNQPEILMTVSCNPLTDPSCSPSGTKQVASGIAPFVENWSNPSSIDSTSIRFDQNISDKLRLFFRFSNANSTTSVRSDPPSIQTSAAYTLRSYTAGATSLLTNHLSNEFRLNYSTNTVTGKDVINSFGGSTPVNLVQLTGFSTPVVFMFMGGQGLTLDQQRQAGSQKQWNLIDTVSLSKGRHQLKFGIDYRRLTPLAVPSNPYEEFDYFATSSVEGNAPDDVFVEATAPAYPLFMNFSAFAQDEWKVTQRLNLSLGVRWEVNPAPDVTQGLKGYTLAGSDASNFKLAPQGTSLWKTTWYNFAPRLGAAYTLSNTPGRETVVRGGGGVFFDTGQQAGSSSFTGEGFTSFNDLADPNTGLYPPFPGPGLSAVPPIQITTPLDPFATFGFAPHLQLPYTLQWNGSIEQALGKSQAFTMSYVGSHSSRLLVKRILFSPLDQNGNPVNPNGTRFQVWENGNTGDYDSLQFQFQRRFSSGLTALGSYTWSHCIDYGSEDYNLDYVRGNCDMDVRHNFSGAFSYDLPNVGQGGFVNAILHGWGWDNRFTARTSFPVTLLGNPIVDPSTRRQLFAGLDLVQGQPVYLYGSQCAACPGGRAINPTAFEEVPVDQNGNPIRLGTAPRNFARGLGAWQMDMAIRRDFPIYERLKLQFRAEAFNIFNHPNFGVVDGNCGGTPGVPGCANPTFGEATGTLANSLGILSPLYQMGGPRSMQFALKLVF